MSRRLAVALFLGIAVAELALRVSQAIDRAVAWLCPCDSPHP